MSVFVILVVIGMVLGGEDDKQTNAAPDSTAPAQASRKGEGRVIIVPTPNAEQATSYLAALREIEPYLVANEDRAVSRGRNTCLDILQRKTVNTVVGNTRRRFAGGDGTINTAQASQVVTAVRVWCRPGRP
ncbi:DUF732 domain-containing protein [Sphaerisporangium corydalis]|uniref:DUF732 domain-containing protein n=1 Tax=Sphaerisporangium corydalis TaxID=1441875 RepID=A0ABV9EEU4_9ACTN|nr:DUF732 domain-containing protein [Sphaerisporangium corydalis]